MQKETEEVIDYSDMRTHWSAFYTDGKSLSQIAANGHENNYGDIDKKKLTKFVLYRYEEPMIVIHLGGNKRLIYRMRRAMNNHGEEETVYLAGWQERKNGMNVQMIAFLFENDHIEIVDRFVEGHPWFYPIQFMPEEEV